MLYHSYTPGLPVGRYVERLWQCSDAAPHSLERIVPSGTIELVINLRHNELRIYDPVRTGRCNRLTGAIVSGTYGGSFVIDTAQHESVIGVHFKPGGAFPFLGAPANELTNAHADLDHFWGRSASPLRERLCEAATPGERFRLLEEALTTRLLGRVKRHAAVAIALDAFERADATVRGVARYAGLSQRRFIRVFEAEVGLTPKLFCRVRRFQRAIALVRRSARPDWASLAATCGYFDQSHLIRDFRALANLTPTEYHRLWTDRVMVNHVPLEPPSSTPARRGRKGQ